MTPTRARKPNIPIRASEVDSGNEFTQKRLVEMEGSIERKVGVLDLKLHVHKSRVWCNPNISKIQSWSALEIQLKFLGVPLVLGRQQDPDTCCIALTGRPKTWTCGSSASMHLAFRC